MDDIFITTMSISKVNKLKTLLRIEFEMKDLGVANKILGMGIRKGVITKNYGYREVQNY